MVVQQAWPQHPAASLPTFYFALDPSQRRPPACAHTSTIRQDLHRGAAVGQHTVSERQQRAKRSHARDPRWHQRKTHPPCILSHAWCTIGASNGRTPSSTALAAAAAVRLSGCHATAASVVAVARIRKERKYNYYLYQATRATIRSPQEFKSFRG